MYWWKGKLEKSDEWLLSIKTRNTLYEKLEAMIKKLHPYETPEITAIPLSGSREYLEWLEDETDQR